MTTRDKRRREEALKKQGQPTLDFNAKPKPKKSYHIATKRLVVEWDGKPWRVLLVWDRDDRTKREGKVVLGKRKWVRFIWNRHTATGEWWDTPLIIRSEGLRGVIIDLISFVMAVKREHDVNIVTENPTDNAPEERKLSQGSNLVRPGQVRYPCIKRWKDRDTKVVRRLLVMPTIVNPENQTDAQFSHSVGMVIALRNHIGPSYEKWGVDGFGNFNDWLVERKLKVGYDAIRDSDRRQLVSWITRHNWRQIKWVNHQPTL